MAAAAAAPAPSWIARQHSPHAIHALDYPTPFLVAGDASGRVSLNDVRIARPRALWPAHKSSILGVRLWSGRIVSHGRDNTLRVWKLPSVAPGAGTLLPSRDIATLPQPELLYELEVNALNYCPFGLMSLSREDAAKLRQRMGLPVRKGASGPAGETDVPSSEPEALVAIPHTLEAAYIDVYHLPSRSRIATAVGAPDMRGTGRDRPGILMSVHLFRPPSDPSTSASTAVLALLAGYEDGRVALWELLPNESATEKEAKYVWSCAWDERAHVESVMSIALSSCHSFAVSVGADARIVHYQLGQLEDGTSSTRIEKTTQAGKSSVALRDDGKVLATGGWDGAIRLYAVSDLRSLGRLDYHRDSVQAIVFSRSGEADAIASEQGNSDSDSDSEAEAGLSLTSLAAQHAAATLAAGGKEGRISLWQLSALDG